MELTRPFAENGDRQDFPVDTQGDGTMSLEQGFGALFGKPPEEGGYFIDRMKFNQLMYLTTKGVIDNKTSIADILNQIQSLESEYGSLLTSSPKLLTENLQWTVSDEPESETNFNTLEKAIKASYKYTGGNSIKITIMKNLIIDKQIAFSQSNNFLIFDFNNKTIDMTNPNASFILNSNKNIHIYNGIFNGLKTNTNQTLFIQEASSSYFYKNIINDAFIGIMANAGGYVNMYQNTFSSCKKAILSRLLSKVYSNTDTYSNNEYLSFLEFGGFIELQFSQSSGNTYESNIAPNTLTPQGIFFKG